MSFLSFMFPVFPDNTRYPTLEDMGSSAKQYSIKTVYLASPYSHKHKKVMLQREKDVTRAAALLMDRERVSFFLPITQSAAMQRFNPNLGNGSFSAWADIDLNEVALRDETWVIMLEGWQQSVGVIAEIQHALNLGKPVKYINPETLELSDQPY